LVGKLACSQATFGSAANPTHATATAMHFPSNAGLIFFTDKLTNDRYLLILDASPSGPLLKWADGQSIPSQGFIKKLCNFEARFLQQPFCKPLWLVPSWALTF
jgi:hypothetical protein